MLVVIADVPYSERHADREMTGTSTLRKAAGKELEPSLTVPLYRQVSAALE